MKLNKYIWLAALPIVFTACQDDALVENPTGQGITTLSCSMEGGLPDSRAQIVFGGTSTSAEYFHWNTGDKFTFFEKEDENIVSKLFTINENYNDSVPSANATFSTDASSALTTGNTFIAYYPCVEADDNGTITFEAPENTISVSDDKIEEQAWKEYFQKYMYMKTSGTVGETSADTKLKFEHLCGLIRITYTNETEEPIEVTDIDLDGSWGSSIILSNENSETAVNQSVENEDGTGMTLFGMSVEAGEAKDFYILFIPPYGEELSPLTEIRINEMTTPATYMGETFSVSGFEAGQSYWFNVTNTGGETLEWTKELHSEEFIGTLEPYMECANFATLKAALASEIVENITLTKDIALLAPIEVNHPVMLNLNEKKLTLGESYRPDETDAVFNITYSSSDWEGIEIVNGDIECAAGNMIQQYLFKLSGKTVRLHLADINISSGGTIPDIVYMDDDNLDIYSSENDEGEKRETNISTTGNIIYGETNAKGNSSWTNIDIYGELNGDFYFKSNNGYLSQGLTINSGTINGYLTFEGVNDEYFENIRYHHQDVTIGTAYTESWLQARTFAEDQVYTVSTLQGLLDALAENQILDETTRINFRKTNDEGTEETFEISLTEPLTITKPVNINLNGNTLSLADNFDFGTSDAAITNTERLSISNGTVEGSSTTTEKYLFKSTNNMNLNFNELTVNANGNLNAVYVDNATFYIYDNEKATSITIADKVNCYAIYAKSSTTPSNVELNINGTITGKVHYELSCSNNEQQSQFRLVRGTVDGAWSTSGEYTNYLQMYFGPESSVSENGNWPTALDILKQDMESDGTYWGKGGLQIEEDITFELDTLFKHLDFVPGELTGSGTITFKQKVRSHNPQPIRIDIANLSDNINIVFEGNFFKDIMIGSTQIQKAMNWADGSGRVEIRLNNDVTLTEQLVGKDMPMPKDRESSLQPGVFCLNLGGRTLTSNVSTGAAIVWIGGMLEMYGGTFETAGDAIQVGAPLVNDSHSGIDIDLRSVIVNSSNGRCVYVHSNESPQNAYKTVHVMVGEKSVLTGNASTGAIVLNGEQYVIDKNVYVGIDQYSTVTPEFVVKKESEE